MCGLCIVRLSAPNLSEGKKNSQVRSGKVLLPYDVMGSLQLYAYSRLHREEYLCYCGFFSQQLALTERYRKKRFSKNARYDNFKLQNISIGGRISGSNRTDSSVINPLHILGNMLAFRLLRDKKIKKIYQVGNVYFWVRFVMLVPGIILFGDFQPQTVETFAQVKGFFIVFDGLVCVLFLSIVRRQGMSQYQPLNANFIEPLTNQLRILNFSAISRSTLNILNYVVYPLLLQRAYSFSNSKYLCVNASEPYDGNAVTATISSIILGDYINAFFTYLCDENHVLASISMIYITFSQKNIFLFMCRILHFLYNIQYHINMLLWDVYCFWDAQTLVDTCILMFNTFVTVLLLCWVTRTYFKARKVLNDGVLKFYYLMMCWGLLFIGKNLFSILVFFIEYWKNGQQIDEYWMQQRITLNSKIYQLLDLLPQMIIQTLMLLIPLHILGKMLEYRLLKDEKTKKWYRAGNIYFKVRILIIVPSITLFPICNLQIVEILSELKGVFIVFDGMICLILLLFRRKGILKEYQPLNADFVQPLKRELRFLVFSLILRFILSTLNYVVFRVLFNFFYQFQYYKQHCFLPEGSYDGDIFSTTWYIVLADFLTHFLPIIVIGRMYKPPS